MNTLFFIDIMGFPWPMGVLLVCWLFWVFVFKTCIVWFAIQREWVRTLELWFLQAQYHLHLKVQLWWLGYLLSSILPFCAAENKAMQGQWGIWTYVDKEGMGWAPERRCRMVLPGILSECKVFPLYSSGIHSHADISLYIGYFFTLIASQRASDTRN